MSAMKSFKTQIIILMAIIAASFIFIGVTLHVGGKNQIESSAASSFFSEVRAVKLGQKIFTVEIAAKKEAQTLGLSGRDSLATNAGMLFVFDAPFSYGFWMKDMKFSIDIVWIDEFGRVVDLAQNISPETFPKIFYPQTPARFVLELNAGAADQNGIKIGTNVDFLKSI